MSSKTKPDDNKFKFKIITNVGDFGLLQPLARTRLRLIVSAIVANIIFFAVTFGVADYINNGSSSVSLNMVLITVSMLLLLSASYIETMLAGDLFFPGNWRERVLLGQKPKEDPEDDLSAIQHQNFNLHFLVVLAVIIVANYYGSTNLTGDYMDEYHEIGFHLTRLRSSDSTEKLAALKELAKPIHKERWHEKRIATAIQGELFHPEEEVRRWAIFTIGKANMTESYNDLIAQLDKGEPATRAEAAEALGYMLEGRSLPHLEKLLGSLQGKQGDGVNQQAIGAIRGLALLRKPEAGPALMPWLDHKNDQVRAHAAWALGQVKHREARPKLLEMFRSQDTMTRCIGLEGLKYVPDPGDVAMFKEEFLLLDSDPGCPYVIWEDRSEEKVYVMFKELYRAKFMKIIINANGDAEKGWLLQVASDKDKPYELRLLASDIIRQLDASMKVK